MNDTHKIVQAIKDNTIDYEFFVKAIVDGIRLDKPPPTDEEIYEQIDNYIWDLYKNSGVQWLDAFDERHRENVRDYIEDAQAERDQWDAESTGEPIQTPEDHANRFFAEVLREALESYIYMNKHRQLECDEIREAFWKITGLHLRNDPDGNI